MAMIRKVKEKISKISKIIKPARRQAKRPAAEPVAGKTVKASRKKAAVLQESVRIEPVQKETLGVHEMASKKDEVLPSRSP
jgi:hypothetical protein